MSDETTDQLTTQEAQDNVRAYYERVDANDVDGLIELFTTDSEYRRPGYEPLRGHDDLRHFYTQVRIIKTGRHTIEHLLVDLPRVVVTGDFAGVLRDGSDSTARFADVFLLAPDGKIQDRETFFSAPLV